MQSARGSIQLWRHHFLSSSATWCGPDVPRNKWEHVSDWVWGREEEEKAGTAEAAPGAGAGTSCEHRQEGSGHLDDAGDVTVVGLIQKEGAEDIVEECGVVSAGSLAVRVEVHLQDLGLHYPLSIWIAIPL